jgi:hypothetical protein
MRTNLLFVNSAEKMSFERPTRRGEDNIKVHLTEIGLSILGCIASAQKLGQCWVLKNAAMKFWV